MSMKKSCRMAVVAAYYWRGVARFSSGLRAGSNPNRCDGTKNGKKIRLIPGIMKSGQRFTSGRRRMKKMEEDLVKQSAVMAGSEEGQRETFRKRYMEYQRKVNQLTQEVQSKKKEVLEEFNKSLEHIVKGIADKDRLTLVVEKGDNGAGALVVYSHPSLDITDRVIKELDKGAR